MSAVSGVWARVTDLEVASGKGCRVTTTSGVEYLDFTSGIAVTSTGHCHPKVVKAIQDQAERFLHAQVNVYRHDLLKPLAKKLREITPAGIDSFFFTNSGAEATEAAVKLAKQATGRPNIITFDGAFHGRTHLTMAMTASKVAYRAGYAPVPAGIFVAPFPFPVDGPSVDQCLDAVKRMLLSRTAAGETAAIVLEPVLGEGGYVPAPPAFIQGLVDICRANDILFVADEVQCGFGRTGTMFAVEQLGVQPDILVMAKGIASGFPLAAIGARKALMERWPVGSHGGTYGGNPMGCAAALATIDVLTEDGFLANVKARGEQLLGGLMAVTGSDRDVTDVRGLGLMVAVELSDPARVTAITRHCLDHGRLILMNAGTRGEVIRWMPPLVATADDIDEGLAAFAAALDATS